jgi:hypothetical protein
MNTGSSITVTLVRWSPLRMKKSVIVVWSLAAVPLRRSHPCFRCVVCTMSVLPT